MRGWRKDWRWNREECGPGREIGRGAEEASGLGTGRRRTGPGRGRSLGRGEESGPWLG